MAVSMHLGSLSFKNGGGASKYKVYIKKVGDAEYTLYRTFSASSTAWGTVETVNLSFYGLEQNTTYLWYVESSDPSTLGLTATVTSSVWYFTTEVVAGGSGGPYYPLRDSLQLNRYLVAATDNKLYYEN